MISLISVLTQATITLLGILGLNMALEPLHPRYRRPLTVVGSCCWTVLVVFVVGGLF